jgi:acetylornithine deacetylase/succinyl-diaminopimelate desuccinylase-like protein
VDVPSVDGSLNAVSPYARAKLNVRVHPEQDPKEAQAAVVEHLRKSMPFGLQLTVEPLETGHGFAAQTDSAAVSAASAAWAAAWGTETAMAGAGGSIPLVSSLAAAVPGAQIVLGGTTDGYANIHGPNERVLLDEFERTTVAIADLFARLSKAAS